MIPVFERLCKRLRPGPNGCLEFQGSRNANGYGTIKVKRGGKQINDRTHRVAWEEAYGPIPDGLCVLHHCDNPPCCEPGHLFLGTHGDNAADRHAKGRSGDHTGENNGRAKLTWEQVGEIRVDGRTQCVIAADYGIHQTTVSRIKLQIDW
jgi:hypothetical protein